MKKIIKSVLTKFLGSDLINLLTQTYQLSKLSSKAKSNDNSYGNEWAVLKNYLDILGIKSGQVVDVAASDGVSQSCTIPLFRDHSWSGLAVEMDPKKFSSLAYIYSNYENCRLARCRVTPENVNSLLLANEISIEFEVLNLDIDSYDLFVIKAALTNGFRPKIITMEINEKIPPPLYFTVKYDTTHYWKGDHFYGCSAAAAVATVTPFGYILASIEYNNAVFIRTELAAGKIKEVSVTDAFNEGYRNRENRKALFPWNQDVDSALDMNADDALSFFDDYFSKYKGKFELKVIKLPDSF